MWLSHAECWRVVSWAGLVWFARERVELSCRLCCLLSRCLLFGTLGLNTQGGVADGQAAQFAGLGSDQGCPRAGVAGAVAWVDPAHAK
jgi:hypothetical protein